MENTEEKTQSGGLAVTAGGQASRERSRAPQVSGRVCRSRRRPGRQQARSACRWAALLCGMLLAAAAHATDRVWIIGGGPDPDYSQAQIESNVIWAEKAIEAIPGRHVVRVYFGSGAGGRAKDVVESAPPVDTASTMQVLARVYDAYLANGDRYRHNRVPDVVGGTDADQLKAHLASDFRAIRPGDRVLIIFNGHGGRNRRDSAGNFIDLWDDTSLTVRDVAGLLDGINPSVPVRFVFTQCYSGGFARLIYRNVGSGGALAPYRRCGFMSVAENRTAEGCSASVNIGDYRDYSTYFFAALTGRARTGGRLPNNPDRDGSGTVSLFEAHLYSLRNARSTDIPRSTSEEYLERWLPWYLKWTLSYDSSPRSPDNPYWPLLDNLARAAGLGTDRTKWDAELGQREEEYRQRAGSIAREQAALARRIAVLQSGIREEISWRWPEAEQPYTEAFRRFLDHDLSAAQAFILSRPRYAALVKEERRYTRLDDEELADERDEAELRKIVHVERLARLRDRFEATAGPAAKSAYAGLLACEQQDL